MIMAFVNRNTKELLVTLEAENCPEFKGSCFSDEYDAIRFDNEENFEDLITKKDGKTYLNYDYNK